MILKIEDLILKIKDRTIINHFSYNFRKGSSTAIIGHNGAGKTTLLKLIVGKIQKTSGSIHIDKNTKIGYCPDNNFLLEHIKAIDFWKLNHKKLENLEELIQELELQKFINTETSKLSSGNQQKVKFINSILHDPDLIIMDEPSQHLDPHSRFRIHKIISDLKSSGKTIIYTTHFLDDINDHTDQCIIMQNGQIIQTEKEKDKIKTHFLPQQNT